MEDLRKPLAILTNNPTFAEELSMKCDGGHEHRPVQGLGSAASANYPAEFGKAVLRAYRPGKEEKSDSKCELSHLHRFWNEGR